MAKRGKDRKPVQRVEVKFKILEPKEWGELFSIYWPPVMRPVMGALFAKEGAGPAAGIVECHSQVMQMNRIFIKHRLPYRLRYQVYDRNSPKNYLEAGEIRLCKVIKYL